MKSLIVIILDESASMYTKKSDVIGGFNEFLKEQKKITTDTARTIFIKFNATVTRVSEYLSINQLGALTDATYTPGYPSSGTALYDAIWEGVQRGEKVESNVDRVLCVIMTDGEENSSRKITALGIRELLKKKEDGGKWTFLYIGENPERWARESGTSVGNSQQYNHVDPADSFGSQTEAVSAFRRSDSQQHSYLLSSCGVPSDDYEDDDDEDDDPPPPYTSR